MGREAICTARFGGQASDGKALLETDRLIFRGGLRLSIPLSAISAAVARDGGLEIQFPDGTAVFELGDTAAQKWAHDIQNPRGLLDKLGVKPGMRVAVLGIDDPEFWADLRARVDEPVAIDDGELDIVFWHADNRDQLPSLADLRLRIQPNGAIWVVSPRRHERLTEVDVMNGAKAHGLVDVKVARFSDTLTAAKLVIPVSQRPKSRA
jgi:hypothetical protein